jgi:branched-chain amino acid transport system ATP-binding protein
MTEHLPAGRPAGIAAPGPSAGPVLALQGVSAGYRQATVLRDVTLRVHAGQVVALLGSNGAGKTTTLRAAAGVIRPGAGTVSLNGTDVTKWPPHRRAASGLCLVPEGRGIFRSLTVRENLRLQLDTSRGSGADALDRGLSVFPALARRLNEVAGRLSGGQQQMLALARAYVTCPAVVLLDEVSMGLAPRIVDEIFGALHQLAETGAALIVVEQYVTRAMHMADTVVLLRKGTVVYDGPADGLDEESVLRSYLGTDFHRP